MIHERPPEVQTLLAWYLTAATDPAVPTTDEDRFRDIGPGFAGFVATGLMVVVVIFLIVDMMRRIRRIRYQSEAQLRQEELSQMGEEQAADRAAAKQLAGAEAAAADTAASVAEVAEVAGSEAAGADVAIPVEDQKPSS